MQHRVIDAAHHQLMDEHDEQRQSDGQGDTKRKAQEEHA